MLVLAGKIRNTRFISLENKELQHPHIIYSVKSMLTVNSNITG